MYSSNCSGPASGVGDLHRSLIVVVTGLNFVHDPVIVIRSFLRDSWSLPIHYPASFSIPGNWARALFRPESCLLGNFIE
jgi:hypothetical protein